MSHCKTECDIGQGRNCHCSFIATRRVLGLSPEQIASLEQRHQAAAPLIEDGHALYPEPVSTDDEALPLPAKVCIWLAALACLAAVFWPLLVL